ncbi:hypothetical protein Vadar_014374 [Vaccinium darrowii]|uniref:Uncharacterized protein n=1 Tax=Vaccinium darrowii TaxID=229202 RepID=A0ACB7ZJB9_9ERIC|nr:hypothetical protein Vadar_014374 [Vaccinium darrowii]
MPNRKDRWREDKADVEGRRAGDYYDNHRHPPPPSTANPSPSVPPTSVDQHNQRIPPLPTPAFLLRRIPRRSIGHTKRTCKKLDCLGVKDEDMEEGVKMRRRWRWQMMIPRMMRSSNFLHMLFWFSGGDLRQRGFKCTGGIMASEAASLLQSFYEQGNPNASYTISSSWSFDKCPSTFSCSSDIGVPCCFLYSNRARHFRPIKENYRDNLPSCINIPLTAMQKDKESPLGEQFSRDGVKRGPMQVQGGTVSADEDEDNKNLFKVEDAEVEEEDSEIHILWSRKPKSNARHLGFFSLFLFVHRARHM